MAKAGWTVKWLIALGVWAVMLAAIGAGPRVDPWIRAVEWTAVAVVSAVAVLRWRAGWADNLPRRVQQWLTDEASDH